MLKIKEVNHEESWSDSTSSFDSHRFFIGRRRVSTVCFDNNDHNGVSGNNERSVHELHHLSLLLSDDVSVSGGVSDGVSDGVSNEVSDGVSDGVSVSDQVSDTVSASEEVR